MDDHHASREIDELKARCCILEARVSALAAFACAVLQENQARETVLKMWGQHMGPTLDHLTPGYSAQQRTAAASIPGWILARLDHMEP